MLAARTILVAALLAACAAAPLCAAGPPQIHPAVARVMAAESDGASFGSATLVGVGDNYGLLVTNWHVVRDTNGFVVVAFPDGFRSTATILRIDRDWDLAALAIRKPNVQPVPLAREAPRPGDPLIIAGYGQGNYRSVAGRCTQYVSPGGSHPYEMVELDASARQGDSGGPIFNARGELAGVLFGTGWGKTAGSYCGRVRDFLYPAWEAMQKLPASNGGGQPAAPAPAYAAGGPNNVAQPPSNVAQSLNNVAQPPSNVAQPPSAAYKVASPWQDAQDRRFAMEAARPAANPGITPAATLEPPPPGAATVASVKPPAADETTSASASLPSTAPKDSRELAASGNVETLRNLLAIAGAILLAFGGLRLLAKAA